MQVDCFSEPGAYHNYRQGNFALSDITGSNSSNYMEPQKAFKLLFTFGVFPEASTITHSNVLKWWS